MGISTKTRKTRSSIVKRFFAKQHYKWGKVQKLTGRLRIKKHYHPLWFLLMVFCLLVHLAAPKNRTNEMFCMGYPLIENVENPSKSKVLYRVSSYWSVENRRPKKSFWQQSEPCYCGGGDSKLTTTVMSFIFWIKVVSPKLKKILNIWWHIPPSKKCLFCRGV